MTFKDYLRDRKAGCDAAGDFVRLARVDSKMPDAASWDELEAYMQSRRESYDVMEAGKAVWRDYETAVKRREAAYPPA